MGPTPSVGNPEEKKSQAQGYSLRRERFQPHIGHPNPGIKRQEDKPGFENQWGLPEGCRKQTLLFKSTLTDLLALNISAEAED